MSANELLPIRVRNLGRHAEGHWIAEVSYGSGYIPVHCKYGSWMHGYLSYGHSHTMYDLKPEVAAELVRLVKKAKKKERAA